MDVNNDNNRWYLACHKPGKNSVFLLQAALVNIGVNTFAPMIRRVVDRTDSRAKRLTIELLFPGYVFIEFDIFKIPLDKIRFCRGFSHFVEFNSKITPVPDSVIDELMDLPMCLIEENVKRPARHQHTLSKQYKNQLKEILDNNNKQERSVMILAFIDALKDK